MLLSVKEMEVRKVRFDETFQPGEIDFSGAGVRQSGPIHVDGEAELLANTDGEVRIKGHLGVKMESECDRCLAIASFPLDCGFDLFYRPSESLSAEEEVASVHAAKTKGNTPMKVTKGTSRSCSMGTSGESKRFFDRRM
jgi:uncharacterized metal-binding protein YceD (DUF177 family)